MKRVESLDYLKGVLALTIMLYHITVWTYGTSFDKTGMLAKLGIYAVSMFFIISGIVLSNVYMDKLKNKSELPPFFIKRLLRIAPLFWFAISVYLFLKFLKLRLGIPTSEFPPASDIFLNYSLLFGIIGVEYNLVAGGWFIGAEVIMYLIFPIIIFLKNINKNYFYLLLLISLLIYIYYAYFLLDVNASLESQWKTYKYPLNHICLFAGGIFIGLNFIPSNKNKTKSIIGFFASILIFYMYPVYKSQSEIIASNGRIIFTILSLLICFNFYIGNIKFENFFGVILRFFGKISYSVYLIHPLVVSTYNRIFQYIMGFQSSYFATLTICVPLVILTSFLTYKFIEKPTMDFGKYFATKLNS